MKIQIRRSQKVAIIIIIVALFLVLENTLVKPPSVFRYPGVQIYDAVRDYKRLETKGFDVTVHVEGTSEGMPIELGGKVTETYAGWFVINSNGVYRIVEGPMGSKDVLSNFIYFNVSPMISVEAIYEPEKTDKFAFREGFRRVKGAIAFDNVTIATTLIQELRNLEDGFYSFTPDRIEVTTFSSGFILDIKAPLPVAVIESLLDKIESSGVQTGYMYYYTGVYDESDIPNIKRELEKGGAIFVNYHKQR